MYLKAEKNRERLSQHIPSPVIDFKVGYSEFEALVQLALPPTSHVLCIL